VFYISKLLETIEKSTKRFDASIAQIVAILQVIIIVSLVLIFASNNEFNKQTWITLIIASYLCENLFLLALAIVALIMGKHSWVT